MKLRNTQKLRNWLIFEKDIIVPINNLKSSLVTLLLKHNLTG